MKGNNGMYPLISVIVPVYNVAPYLERCLNSILGQTYRNIEVIVIDDGSIDETGTIADEYEKKYSDKIKIFHMANGGVSNARLAGIAHASGEWVGFVDGDDEIESDMYERLMKNAQKYNADISHCGYQTIVNEGERIHYFHNTGRIEYLDHVGGIKELLKGSFEPSLCNKLYRKTLFCGITDDIRLDRSIKYNEDLLMNYILFDKANATIYEDFCPYHYISRQGSASRKKFCKETVCDPVRVWEIILEHVCSDAENIAKQAYLRASITAYGRLCSYVDYKMETKLMRNKLIYMKKDWKLLDKNNQIKVYMIYWFPMFYKYFEKIYVNYFQRKIYE